jgi:hypothetical protein
VIRGKSFFGWQLFVRVDELIVRADRVFQHCQLQREPDAPTLRANPS